MGKPQSKQNSVTGDPQVAIINHLEEHSSYHEQNQLLLVVAIALLALSTGYILLKHLNQWHRKEAMRAARSLAHVNDV